MSDEGQSAALEVEELTFEQAFNELATTVEHLEEGDLTLEEAIALYKRGMRLARYCNDALDAAELQVQQVTVVNNQQQTRVSFEED